VEAATSDVDATAAEYVEAESADVEAAKSVVDAANAVEVVTE
jgi:hypothetical protein